MPLEMQHQTYLVGCATIDAQPDVRWQYCDDAVTMLLWCCDNTVLTLWQYCYCDVLWRCCDDVGEDAKHVAPRKWKAVLGWARRIACALLQLGPHFIYLGTFQFNLIRVNFNQFQAMTAILTRYLSFRKRIMKLSVHDNASTFGPCSPLPRLLIMVSRLHSIFSVPRNTSPILLCPDIYDHT